MNMLRISHQHIRILIVVTLTLLPWPAVWIGMYELRSIGWTFVAYHGLCLLPAIIWKRNLWLKSISKPSKSQWFYFLIAVLSFTVSSIGAFMIIGNSLVNRESLLEVLTQRGFAVTMFLPLSFYLIAINATLEELFWRGVILNELRLVAPSTRHVATIWTAVSFAAWHYLVFRLLLRPGWAELSIVFIIGVGFFSSWLYEKSGSIVLPIIWHAFVFDMTVMVVFYLVLKPF